MKILQSTQAGTLQSSDLIVFVEPSDRLDIEIESTVSRQFGHLIRERVDMVVKRLNVERGRIQVSDRGALDYAIEARVETAIRRGGG